jgi:valyl-tRNA synthetase
MSIPEKYLKPYNPKDTEGAIYDTWEKSELFNPDKLPERHIEPFSIVLPPPNVTGTLHAGHAMMLAIQDTLIRFERMRGKKTLWLPGVDHAAIATQSKVEEIIYKKDGKTRYDIGRENLLEEVNKFAKESHDTIVSQVKRMGSSLDWSREAYTLDEKRSLAVNTAFKKMYQDGLIYRGKRIVNWDPKMQTTVSDDEIEYKEETTKFYYLKYGPFTIGTARPETKFGDKYVVMHPDDTRYSDYKHGDKIKVDWINGEIEATIIKDESIDMEFGTGVMTITPAHSHIDFEIAQKHNLSIEQIIDERGLLLPIAGELTGQHIKKARPLVIEKLQAKGLVEKIDEHYVHNIATNSRGGGVIEPQIKLQWFINVNKEFTLPHSNIPSINSGDKTTLKEIMRVVIESGTTKIIPDRFEKIYYHWIDNLRDWCISRQIWFGHRIPVWYKSFPAGDTEIFHMLDMALPDTLEELLEDEEGGENCTLKIFDSETNKELHPTVSEFNHGLERPVTIYIISKEEGYGRALEKSGFTRDEDTLDTWFSSGLWTFSTLGWPDETTDLKTFHPTSVLETGYDILFFWVARMILMSGYLLGETPFKTIYLHGLVRDAKGQKMSKSLGNIIDPVDMIDKYGADALRMALIIGTGPGSDSKLSEDKIRAYKLFSNKIWNITRFVLDNTSTNDLDKTPTLTGGMIDVNEQLKMLIVDITKDIEEYRFHIAGEKLYHYIWHTFADIVIEDCKREMKEGSAEKQQEARWFLRHTLLELVKLLHPFMPFITEEIWKDIGDNQLLMIERWPTIGDNSLND